MRSAIYARTCGKETAEHQVQTCHDYAERSGITVRGEHIYCDEMMQPRTALAALMTAARAHEFDTVIIDKPSRLTHDRRYLGTLIASFTFIGVHLIGVSDLESSENGGRRLDAPEREDADDKNVLRRTREVMGWYVAGNSFGYTSTLSRDDAPDGIKGYTLAINPDEAAIIVRIFTSFVEGASPSAITTALNGEKTPVRTKAWTVPAVMRILTGERYRGRLTWRRTTRFTDSVPGMRTVVVERSVQWVTLASDDLRIVTDELWAAAAQKIAGQRTHHPIDRQEGAT